MVAQRLASCQACMSANGNNVPPRSCAAKSAPHQGPVVFTIQSCCCCCYKSVRVRSKAPPLVLGLVWFILKSVACAGMDVGSVGLLLVVKARDLLAGVDATHIRKSRNQPIELTHWFVFCHVKILSSTSFWTGGSVKALNCWVWLAVSGKLLSFPRNEWLIWLVNFVQITIRL